MRHVVIAIHEQKATKRLGQKLRAKEQKNFTLIFFCNCGSLSEHFEKVCFAGGGGGYVGHVWVRWCTGSHCSVKFRQLHCREAKLEVK